MRNQSFSLITLSGVLFFLMLSTLISCVQEDSVAKATVETSQVKSITEANATIVGIITSNGGSEVTSQGFCWSTSPTPTIKNDTSLAKTGTFVFTCTIKGLTPSTTYYVRAFAVNKGGVVYGQNMIFTTKTFSISTTPISVLLLSATSAIGGGSVISDGDSSGLTVVARGVCWNTSPSPTIENNKTIDGNGGGRFTSMLDSLTANTTYYVRAYATNENGTIYGNEVSFTTLSGVIELTTNAVYSITAYSATSGGTITSDGGSAIQVCGVCWSISKNPTIADSKTTNGSTSGSYTCSMSGLAENTKYYVRSWATNSVGTTYGNENSFTTLTSSGTVTDIDGNVYNLVVIGSQTWMVENLKTTKFNDGTSIPLISSGTSWLNVTTPGYGFYNNDAANKQTYGALYNWYTVNSGKLAPNGWHVPTDAEWTTLEIYLTNNGYGYQGSGSDIAKSLAASSAWSLSSTIGAIGNDTTKNNASGFTALPCGWRGLSGTSYEIGYKARWWSSTPFDLGSSWIRELYYDASGVTRTYVGNQGGYSVRCIKD